MKISLNWLKDYVEFDKKLSVKDIAWRLTEATAEIEKIHILGNDLNKVVIGKLLEVSKHPDADKLKVCKVDVGEEKLQIVCGGTNLLEKMLVAVSLPGAMVRWHGQGDLVEVKVVKLRGVESTGMICASDEIGLGKMFPAEESVILDLSSYKAKPGQEIKEVLGFDDVVFEVDNHSITHRSDLFSHLGFACECVALGIAKWKKQPKETDPRSLLGKKKLPLKVEFQRKDISKNYFGTVIENLSTKESPDWMKTRLSAVGIRSINAIVDITNYIMMDVGQPSHAFDWRVLQGKTFNNRLSKKGETMVTLDGVKRELPEGIIIAETEDGIIDLAGVMGGKDSEIRNDTTTVYFHSSQFSNTLIRKTMITLGHRTDGGTMHEKNIEAQRSEFGYYRGITLFKKIFPEAVFPYETIHIQHEKTPEISIDLLLEKITSHIGVEIPAKVVKTTLVNLGFEVTSIKGGFRVKVPTWRSNNISIPEDLVEEVARIYGYSNIAAQPPTVELVTPHRVHKRHVKRIAQQFLIGQGFQEEVNFSFLSEQHLRNIGYDLSAGVIEIKNPVSDDFRFMRPNFLPYLLSNLARNQLMQRQLWKTFEMGAVYTRNDDEVLEQHRLTFVVSTEQESFFQAKGIIEGLFRELSLVGEMEESVHAYAYPGRSLQLMAQGRAVGHVYDLHPLLIEQFGLKGSVAIGDIDLDQLYQLRSDEVFYKTLNRNPQALLDVSVIVAEQTMMSEIECLIHSVEGQYLKKAQLVDVYQGKNIGEGKKSLTFALAYQHPERTFDEKEIQTILDTLIKKLEAAGGAVRR
jgi:phenylalanyl-tRNA synthetase beta chain